MNAEYKGTPKGIRRAHRKEDRFTQAFIGLVIDDCGNTVMEAVDLRIYQTDRTTCCCLWVKDKNGSFAVGSGKHTGYGCPSCRLAVKTLALRHLSGSGDPGAPARVFG